MSGRIRRREFLKHGAVVGGALAVPPMLSGAAAALTPLARGGGLKIHARFLSSQGPKIAGGGTLRNLFAVAAQDWERAFSGSGKTWVVHLDYMWATLKQDSAEHILTHQGGTPSREKRGLILFNVRAPWFADPNPRNSKAYPCSEAFTCYEAREATLEVPPSGSVNINAARVFRDPHGDAIEHYDLYSVAAHEIGHALGFDVMNREYMAQTAKGSLPITIPGPYDGSVVLLGLGHLPYVDALMASPQQVGVRYLISAIDVLANAQISHFDTPTYDPYS